jgi:hypothetical protein
MFHANYLTSSLYQFREEDFRYGERRIFFGFRFFFFFFLFFFYFFIKFKILDLSVF